MQKMLDPEKFLPSVNVSYTGQTGFGGEMGLTIQEEMVFDIYEGRVYHSRTVGYFGYIGTPTGLQGEIGIGLGFLHNVPLSVRDLSDVLEGEQYDASGQIGVDFFGSANVNVNLSYDIKDDKLFYYPSTGFVFTKGLGVSFAFNGVPNGIEGGLQFGRSATRVIEEKK